MQDQAIPVTPKRAAWLAGALDTMASRGLVHLTSNGRPGIPEDWIGKITFFYEDAGHRGPAHICGVMAGGPTFHIPVALSRTPGENEATALYRFINDQAIHITYQTPGSVGWLHLSFSPG